MKVLKFKWPQLFFIVIVFLFLFKIIIEYLFLKWYEISIGINNLKIDLQDLSIDKYSEQPRNFEWEQIDKFTFFKRSAAYYFLDKRMLRVFYITSANNVPEFEIDVIFQFKYRKSFKITLKNANSKRHDQWDKYRSSSLNYDLSFFQSFNTDINKLYLDKNLVKMSILIRDSKYEIISTQTPIEVKIKYLRTQPDKKREGSMICSKCYYYSDYLSFKHFEWWFELNKKIGYNKITFCNSTIPDTYEYRRLFDKYENSIYIYQMQFLPNLIDKNQLNDSYNEYLTSFFDLKRKDSFYKPLTRVFDNIIFQECYLDNVDKYKYITIIDNDEAIVPRVNPRLVRHRDNYNLLKRLDYNKKYNLMKTVNELEKKCWQNINLNDLNLVDTYVQEFKALNGYMNDKSIYYKMGIYLKDRIVEKIFKKMEYSLESEFREAFLINVIDFDDSSEYHKPNNYSFKISDQDEFNYAKALCKIYNYLIKNFQDKYKSSIEKYSNRFNRFFYIAGESTIKHFGKTIHSTDWSLQMIHHYPVDTTYYMVKYDTGHVSHFRDSYEFNPKFFPIPVKDLFVDLNYFYCFYKPILFELEKIV
jgi:hypothetical protein